MFVIFFRKSPTRKMIMWKALIGTFKIFARFWAPDYVSFIMFVRYYMLNAFGMAQWHTCRLVTFMTWVRAPGLHSFNVIFHLVFTCSFNMVDHYAPSESSHPRVPHYQSQEHNLKNTVYCSQPLHKLHEKVNKAML